MAQNAEITVGAALEYRRRMAKGKFLVDLTPVTAVEIRFESGETITLPPGAIASLMFYKKRPRQGGRQFVADGFWLRAADGETTSIAQRLLTGHRQPRTRGVARLRDDANVAAITLKQEGAAAEYLITWSALSAPRAVNVAQFFARAEDQLIVLAMAPETYLLGELAQAAQQRDHRAQIVSTLVQGLESVDEAAAAALVDTVLDELVSFAPLAVKRSDQHIVVHHAAVGYSEDPGLAWQAVFYDDYGTQEYGGIDLLSYPELLGMDVRIEGEVFEGFAWLLWQITLEGAEAVARAKNIQAFHASLGASDAQDAAFHQATAKMRRFLDDYARQHSADPALPDVIQTYWPLTEGMKATLAGDASTGNVLTKQDPKLMAKFMKQFGDAFARFE
ncbi:hypothetical protein ACFQ3L_09440 [Lacticaseibacillus jixianensis]|uniref:Uncharacterized protein n=1 Tax=Lacticaseibacillus jixianensis TaxID=2486012 RepID=A0ABW4BCP3_9LACO|nr:hypothetical protein [Lacticaseibacillus jixianensis]